MRAAARTSIADLALGNYQPLLELACGGMAKVYLARQVGAAGFERLVVVKRVHRHLLSNREFCDMFRDEARLCSTIRHPNVVAVVDTVEAEGELFLVLEYVESLPLSALLQALAERGERLDPAVAVRIFADALAGLHAAHEAVDLRGNRVELIHRDVSPQNIIVGLDGTSRLIDFGIAKAASRISVTHSGIVKGKLRYMSPEQMQQKAIDRRADIFSAGVVLYEALTGERPFVGEDDGDIALSILLGEPRPPCSVVRDLPSALDAVLERALARNPEDRFQTAAEFQEALEGVVASASARDVARVVEVCGGEEFEGRRAVVQARIDQPPASARRIRVAAVEREPSSPAPPVVVTVPPHRPSRPLLFVIAAVVVVLVAVLAKLIAREPSAASAPPGASVSASAVESPSPPAPRPERHRAWPTRETPRHRPPP